MLADYNAQIVFFKRQKPISYGGVKSSLSLYDDGGHYQYRGPNIDN